MKFPTVDYKTCVDDSKAGVRKEKREGPEEYMIPQGDILTLSHKTGVLGMSKITRNDFLFKFRHPKNPPATTMRKPMNEIVIFGVAQNGMKLKRKGGLLCAT